MLGLYLRYLIWAFSLLFVTDYILYGHEIIPSPHSLQWRPSITWGALGVCFILGSYLPPKGLLHWLLGHFSNLSTRQWKEYQLLIGCQFIAMALINLLVVYWFSAQTWADYKLFGSSSLALFVPLYLAYWVTRVKPH
ncbi:septation protein IspZ [Neptunicella marina]|uniref:Septation protein IspZ n=1 Tax=Neptunicella marina TaxID=2125989 RepID=A0A8J6IRG5_9ALTE|nr:septation protein IspZ [Neptunicella marina]MBC3766150.1 septation protein IspZ [Neptunicella marina]